MVQIKVKILPNDQDWEFVVKRGRWHSHDNFKTFCKKDCLVMAVF